MNLKESLNGNDLESIHESEGENEKKQNLFKDEGPQQINIRDQTYQVNEEGSQSLDTQKEQKKATKRSVFTDWMRSIAIYLVVFTHIIVSIERSIKTQDSSYTGQCVNSYLRVVLQFGMPIFFYFSGRSAFFSKDNFLIWTKKKTLRLILPLIFGTLFIVIPTAYIGRFYRPQVHKEADLSFWKFYAYYFQDEFMSNGFEWLWFLPVLYGAALLNYPFIQLMKNLYNRAPGESIMQKWNLIYLGIFVVSCNVLAVVCCIVLDWHYYGFILVVLSFMLVSIFFMVQIDFFRKNKILEGFYLPCIVCVLCMAACQKYFTRDYISPSDQVSMFVYLDVFYVAGFIDEITYKEYTNYRTSQTHQNRKPFGMFFFLILFCICMPGTDIQVGYMYSYPIYQVELIKVLYCLGTWFWIYFLVRWCQQFFDEYINKTIYKFLMESCMVTYLVHWFFLEIANRYFVYQKINNFFIALLILTPWTFLCCNVTYLICKKVPYIGLFLGLAEEGKTGSFKKKQEQQKIIEEEEQKNNEDKFNYSTKQILVEDEEISNQLKQPLNHILSTDTQ